MIAYTFLRIIVVPAYRYIIAIPAGAAKGLAPIRGRTTEMRLAESTGDILPECALCRINRMTAVQFVEVLETDEMAK